jgi:nucleoside-triphosphatase
MCKYSQTLAGKMTTPLQTKPLVASLLSGEQNLTFLTAPRGAGKTTFCWGLVTQVHETGALVGGFICPAVFEDGKKIGIDMVDVASGERRRLGMRSSEVETTIGCWQLDENVIQWGNQILAGLKDEDFIVIDELGPLELEEGYGFQEAMRLLDEKRYRAALVVVRPSLLQLARLRWPGAQVLDLARERA